MNLYHVNRPLHVPYHYIAARKAAESGDLAVLTETIYFHLHFLSLQKLFLY